METHIQFDQVGLAYGKQIALSDIHLEMKGPKIYGLLGRNGAGKTSLLALLSNYRQPSSGSLLVNGETLFENETQAAVVHFAFQRKFDEEYESGESLLEIAANFRGTFDIDYAAALAERFRFDLKKPMHKHSTGMASIFQIIKGMASRAPITIFDEAYTGMDAPARELFYEIIREDQQNHPRVFILSTHLISEMEHLFDEIIILHEGKLLLHEPYEELLSQGASITGEASLVDQFTSQLQVLKEQRLGGTKSVIVFRGLTDQLLQEADEAGLEIGRVSVQDVFTNVTKGGEPHE